MTSTESAGSGNRYLTAAVKMAQAPLRNHTQINTKIPIIEDGDKYENRTWRKWLTARQILQEWGNTSTCFMTLSENNKLFIEAANQAFLAYRQCCSVALTLGDPIGSPEAAQRCINEFLAFCKREKLVPVFFAIEHQHSFYRELGLRSSQIAEDAYLSLENLAFKGKCWQDVRTALNRAKREQLEFRQLDLAELTPDLYQQLEEVSQEWLRGKRLPELGFTLGSLASIENPAVRTYYAMGVAGKVQGFVSWLPMYGTQGWALDLMRRRCDAMQGLMEFLIASSILRFQEEGYSSVGLGASPLAPVQRERQLCPIEKFLHHSIPTFNRFYRFNSLFTFKRKFQPEWKPLYMFYPSIKSFPRVTLALTTLYFGLNKNKKTDDSK